MKIRDLTRDWKFDGFHYFFRNSGRCVFLRAASAASLARSGSTAAATNAVPPAERFADRRARLCEVVLRADPFGVKAIRLFPLFFPKFGSLLFLTRSFGF